MPLTGGAHIVDKWLVEIAEEAQAERSFIFFGGRLAVGVANGFGVGVGAGGVVGMGGDTAAADASRGCY